MKIILCWKDKEILEIQKLGEKYFSKIIIENFEEAVNTGFPYVLIDDVKVIDKKLPYMILSRLSKSVSTDNEEELVEYINETHLERQTDYITAYIKE